MKNKELAKGIKELRLQHRMSQEELAEKSALSLRTIQRIENGETIPRSDSVKRIFGVLGEDMVINSRQSYREEILIENYSRSKPNSTNYLIYKFSLPLSLVVTFIGSFLKVLHVSYSEIILMLGMGCNLGYIITGILDVAKSQHFKISEKIMWITGFLLLSLIAYLLYLDKFEKRREYTKIAIKKNTLHN